jgi:hypothetical protein
VELPTTSAADEARARMRASLRAVLITALLLGCSLASPALAVLLGPLLPIPFAFVLLRHGSRPVVGATVGLVLAGVVAGFADGVAVAVGLTIFLAGSTAGLGWVLAQCGELGRLREHPLVAMTAGWLAVLGAVAGCALVVVGTGDLDRVAKRAVAEVYDPITQSCKRGETPKRLCEEIDVQRAQVQKVVVGHAPMTMALVLALGSLAVAATTLLTARPLARRAQLPLRRQLRMADLEAHWSAAYLVAAGVGAVMLAGTLGSDHPIVLAGAMAGALGLAAFVLQGIAVTAWLLGRSRLGTGAKVAIWALLFLTFFNLALGWFLGLGLLEFAFHLRRRGRPRAGSTGSP